MYACQSNEICKNENTIINKEKKECCELICAVYLRCLFKYYISTPWLIYISL